LQYEPTALLQLFRAKLDNETPVGAYNDVVAVKEVEFAKLEPDEYK